MRFRPVGFLVPGRGRAPEPRVRSSCEQSEREVQAALQRAEAAEALPSPLPERPAAAGRGNPPSFPRVK